MTLLIAFLHFLFQGPIFPGPGMTGGVPLPPTSGMQIWYSADVGSNCGGSTCIDGNTQTTWLDRSPAANNANTGTCGTTVFHTNQINGKPAVTFSTSCFRFGTNVDLKTASSTFIVLKLASTAAKQTALSSFGAVAGLGYWFANTGKLQGADKTCSAQLGTGTAAQNTNWNQVNMTYNATTVSFRLNRASDGSASASNAITATEAGIGQSGCGATESLTGQMAEIIIYNRVLTGPEITTVETYLNARYAL